MRKDHTWAIPPCSSLIIFEKLLPFFFFFFLLQIFFFPSLSRSSKRSMFSSQNPITPSSSFSDLTVPPILVAAGAYLPGQAITCFPVSAVSNMASFISSMASLVAGPTHGERSPLLLSGAASSSNIYKKTKYPLALQRGSTSSYLKLWLQPHAKVSNGH